MKGTIEKRMKTIMALVMCTLLSACNTNEVLPVIPVVQKDPNDLLAIVDANITTAFNASTRQTMQFATAQSENNIGNLNFYGSHNLATANTNIINVIVNFHGLSATDPNVSSEYNSLRTAVAGASLSATTLVLSPHFNHEGTGLELDWENATWRAGGKASTPSGATLSSSQIVDFFLTQYFLDNANFPNLTNVIIAGHSAGGQLAQRYAAISRVENNFSDYRFTYIPANASHYLYLNDQRWDGSGTYIPLDCPTYNEYPYGLDALAADSRYAFISKIGLETIKGNYINRKVYYVLGDQDVTGATTDCESQSQQGGAGASRYTRGQYLFAFMGNQYPVHNHEVRSVAGVGHNPDGIYTSTEFVNLLTELLD